MKFTVVLTVLLGISTTRAIKTKITDPKDKREAASGSYPLPSYPSHSFQSPSQLNQEDASAVSIGAGYSVGGAKPTYSFAGQDTGATYQFQPEGLHGSGQASIQLAPISIQPSHGSFASNDLSQLMSQISQGINSGAIAIPSGGQGALYQFASPGGHGGQEISSLSQFAYGSPKLQQYSFGDQAKGAVPAYALGTKGLGTYGSTGPVLFNPDSSANQAALSYGAPASIQSSEAAALSLGDSGHSLPAFSFGGSGNSFGGSLKSFAAPGKSSFKPSAFLGSSVQSDSGHSLAGLTGSHGSPSFAAYQSSSNGHGAAASLGSGAHSGGFGSLSSYTGGPSKLVAATYLPSKSEGIGSLESIASAFSASGQLASPLGTTYGVPSGAYSNNLHAGSAPSPTYYISSGKQASPSFASGSSLRGPLSGYSSINSFSSAPKYSFGGHSSSRYAPPKDIQGSYSESSYNTIKYSEELKPRYN